MERRPRSEPLWAGFIANRKVDFSTMIPVGIHPYQQPEPITLVSALHLTEDIDGLSDEAVHS